MYCSWSEIFRIYQHNYEPLQHQRIACSLYCIPITYDHIVLPPLCTHTCCVCSICRRRTESQITPTSFLLCGFAQRCEHLCGYEFVLTLQYMTLHTIFTVKFNTAWDKASSKVLLRLMTSCFRNYPAGRLSPCLCNTFHQFHFADDVITEAEECEGTDEPALLLGSTASKCSSSTDAQ